MRSAIPTASVLIFSVLSAACIGGRPVHYYTINPPAGTSAVARPLADPNGLVLLVGRIATPEALQDGRIRYRSGSNEVGSYEYHRWTERPGTMVRDLLLGTLRSSGKYRQVQEAGSSAAGDYLVRGKLYEFSELDDSGIHTRVSLQLELVDRKSGRVVWDRHYNRDEPVNGKAIEDVVISLEHNLQQVIAEAAAGVESFLSAPRPPSV